jgi:phosphoribosyl-ATP pyrophosphohydrolase
MSDAVILKLVEIIRARRHAPGETSYTRQLLDAGPERCARKLGEEAIETVIAALGVDPSALVGEAADVIYHLLVLLEIRGVAWSEVSDVLAQRMEISGVAEKAGRVKTAS